VAETADQVVTTSQKISELFAADKERTISLKRAGISAGQVHDVLRRKAMISAIDAASKVGVSVPTARAALNNLKSLNIVSDVKGHGKERLYIYSELIALLDQRAEPIAY